MLNSFYGDIPDSFTILVSCEKNYLYEHAPAMVASCALYGNDLHIHLIEEGNSISPIPWDFVANLKTKANKINPNFRLTTSGEMVNLSKYSDYQKRTYYACNRFIVASKLLSQHSGSLLILDIDSFTLKKIEQPTADLGLFLRDSLPGTVGWESEGSRIAAGMVYYNNNMQDFARSVFDIIEDHHDLGQMNWFLDQLALNIVYKNYRILRPYNSFIQFTPKDMDWEFIEGTTIWTGKGNRKNDNLKYLGRKREFEKLLFGE